MPENPDVPLELWDNIIDHLWDNCKSLATCSLVCRAWLPSTRIHLFHTVMLTPFTSDGKYTEKLQALHRIASFIQILKIHPHPQAVNERLWPALHAMGRVHTIMLVDLSKPPGYWGESPCERFMDRLSRFPPDLIRSIKKLKFGRTRLDLNRIVELLTIFRNISDLDIFSISSNRQDDEAHDNLPRHNPPLGIFVSQLTYRHVDATRAAHFLKWLRRESSGRFPHTFRLFVERPLAHPGFVYEYSPMLREFGASLQHLWLIRSIGGDTIAISRKCWQ